MDPVSTLRRIFTSPYTLGLRFARWLLADDRFFYRGSHRRAAVAAERTVAEPLVSPDSADSPVTAGEPVAAGESAAAEAATVDVTFTLPSEVGAGDVLLCGDFNGWTAGGTPLRRGSDGAWQVTVPLEPGNSYHFRYLLDGQRWENAWQADRYEPNPFGSDNSVVIVEWPQLTLQAA
jgi:hypothetical protein